MLNLRSMVAGSVAILLLGCHGKDPSTAQSPPVSGSANETIVVDPHQQLYEQMRSGNFQLQASLDSLEAALKHTQALRKQATDPETKTRLGDIERVIDTTGRAMAEHYGEPPSQEEIRANEAAAQADRKKTISDANDSLHDLQESRDMLSRLETAAGTSKADLEDLGRLIDVSMDDLRGVVEALGGREEIPGDRTLP